MTREQLVVLNPTQRSLVAVAYLMGKKELRPESSIKLFEKLESYDSMASGLSEEMKKAQKFINESRSKLNQFIGSVNTLSELIAEQLPKENIDEWCLAYQLPEPVLAGQDSLNNNNNSQAKIDMAGSTSKTLPQIDIDELSKGK